MNLYKVLNKQNGILVSPFRNFEYEPGKEYVCDDFDTNTKHDCSRGYYATGIDGLICSFRNLPGCEVWECEVGGRKVEIDQFKRRYERIKIVCQVPIEEVKRLASVEEKKVGYKLAEALFPVNPLKIKAGTVTVTVTETEIKLLRQWASVGASVWDSVWDSVNDSVRASVGASVVDSVRASVGASVRDSVRDSVWDSVVDSVRAYISSLFPGIKKWKYIDHPEGENPFQPCIDLWHRGLVPSYDGKVWRLHAGEKAEIVWEGKAEGGRE